MVCGEWEVGSVPASWSGEQYNIVLDVLEITPHPLYNVSAGEITPPPLYNVSAGEITPHPLYNVSAGEITPHPLYNVSAGDFFLPPPLP